MKPPCLYVVEIGDIDIGIGVKLYNIDAGTSHGKEQQQRACVVCGVRPHSGVQIFKKALAKEQKNRQTSTNTAKTAIQAATNVFCPLNA